MIVEAEEESKDDVGNVTEPEGWEELLSDTDGRHELANTKDETPPLARSELTEKREGELSQYRTSIDRGTKSDEAAELVADLGANTRTESKVHGTGTLRMTYIGKLRTTGGSSDVVDDISKIKGELLETPSPEARIRSSVFGVTSFEVGPDVGDPNVKALVNEPESHGTLLVDDKVRRVAENTVLKDDRVTNRAASTRIRDSVSLKDPATFGDDLVLIALIAPELGIVGRSSRASLTCDPTLVFTIGLCLWWRLFERVKVGKVSGKEDSAECRGADEEGDGLAEVESKTLEGAVVAVIGNDVVEEGHLEGGLILVAGESWVEEGPLIAMRILASARVSHDLDTRRTAIEIFRGIFEGSLFCLGSTGCAGGRLCVALKVGVLSRGIAFVERIVTAL